MTTSKHSPGSDTSKRPADDSMQQQQAGTRQPTQQGSQPGKGPSSGSQQQGGRDANRQQSQQGDTRTRDQQGDGSRPQSGRHQLTEDESRRGGENSQGGSIGKEERDR